MRQLVLLFLVVLFGIQCRKNGTPSPTPPPPVTEPGRTIIAGLVMDEQYKPLSGVEITVANIKQFTDGNGVFMIPDVPVTNNRTYLVCKKDGYFNAFQSLKTADGGVTQFNMILPKKVFVQNFAAGSGVNATVSNAKVAIPANSIIIDNGGGNYNGTVTMSARHINPDDANFPSLMPGGDFAAVNSENNNVELLSFGAIEVELESNSGERLQLMPGKEATLTFPIAASQLATAPATIPLWEFDEEAGKWREEGIATKQGNYYIGKVKHFSTHNVDKPLPQATVKGTVRNCEGQPMRGIPVRIGSEQVTTDAGGNYEVVVTALEPMKGTVENFFESGGTTISKQIHPLAENERRTVDFTMDCVLEITGSISICGGNEETPGLVTLKWTGGTAVAVTDGNGKFSISAPRNKQVALNAYGFGGIKSPEQIINTPDGGKKDIGEIVVCEKEEQGEVVFTLDGSGHNNETITINDGASAFVPEAIYYKDDNETLLMKTGLSGHGFQARTDGKSTGAQDDFHIAIVYAKEINGEIQSYTMVPVPGKVTFTITKYGAVGDKVEGTFSGTFRKFTGSSPNFTELQVKNGRFSLYRSPDEL